MDISTIGAMLSADSPRPIDGSARGGKPTFTKEDAMQAVSGMNADAWDYMQYIYVMMDEKIVSASAKCAYIILTKYSNTFKDEQTILYNICEAALVETRKVPYSNAKRARMLGVTEYIYRKQYRDIYHYALMIYNNWESDARLHIKRKLG